jgi:hypothetical protein
MAVKGLQWTISRLRKLDATIQQEVKEEVFDTAQQIASEATSKAPKSIVVNAESTNNGYSAKISTNIGNIAAYVEFGTGLSAEAYVPTLPDEWQEMALSFYIDGKGTMKKQPYLYPAYFRNIPILKKNLSDMLKRETKK